MAERMDIGEFGDALTETIDRVRSGETIEVTDDGETVAVIAPYRRSRLDKLIAEGRVTPARQPFSPPKRLRETKGPKSATEILQEGREDR